MIREKIWIIQDLSDESLCFTKAWSEFGMVHVESHKYQIVQQQYYWISVTTITHE
jgi:hypothetical protein